MKRQGFIILAALALTALTACQNEYSGTAHDPDGTPIQLSAQLSPTTRGHAQADMYDGLKCYVWADQQNAAQMPSADAADDEMETLAWFRAWALRTDDGKLVPWTANDMRYYPADNRLDLYAVIGNFVTTPVTTDVTEYPADEGLVHTVSDDQREADAYHLSDLMYGALTGQKATNQTINLHFYHLLSQLQVVLVPGADMDAATLQSATVTVVGVRRNALFLPAKDADLTLPARRAALVRDAEAGNKGEVRMANATATAEEAAAEGFSAYSDAVLPPQTIQAGTDFICVRYDNQVTYFRLTDDLVMVGGQSYTLRLEVERFGDVKTVTPTVGEWDAQPKSDQDLSYIYNWDNVTIDPIENVTYTGAEQEPAVTVRYRGTEMVENRDYYVSYTDNVHASTDAVKAKATVIGQGLYEGSQQTVEFTIDRCTPEITFDESPLDLYRTGTDKRVATATYGSGETKADIDAATYITYATTDENVATVNVHTGEVTAQGEGTATITATVAEGPDWVSGSKTYDVSITTIKADQITVADVTDQTYTGSEIKPEPQVKSGQEVLTKGRDFDYLYSDDIINVGDKKVYVKLKGRFSGQLDKDWKIIKRPLSDVTVATIPAYNWDGTAKQPTPAVTYNGMTLNTTDHFTYSYGSNTAAGTNTAKCTITAKDNCNYTGSKTVTFTINKVAGSITCSTVAIDFGTSANGSTKTRTGVSCTGGTISVSSSATGSCTASYSGGTITLTRKTTAAFSVTITVSLSPDANHTAPTSKTFTVKGSALDSGVALSSSTVGMKVGTNGKAYATNASMPSGVSAVGVVTYKSGSSGYVVALWNCGGSTSSDGSTYAWTVRANGLSGMTAVSGRSWIVGSKDQYTKALTSDWSNNMTRIVNAGGRPLGLLYYWTSTERYRYVNHNWDYISGTWYGDGRNGYSYVRPLLAF